MPAAVGKDRRRGLDTAKINVGQRAQTARGGMVVAAISKDG